MNSPKDSNGSATTAVADTNTDTDTIVTTSVGRLSAAGGAWQNQRTEGTQYRSGQLGCYSRSEVSLSLSFSMLYVCSLCILGLHNLYSLPAEKLCLSRSSQTETYAHSRTSRSASNTPAVRASCQPVLLFLLNLSCLLRHASNGDRVLFQKDC